MKMYIAVLDEFPDYMTPTLVAHAALGAYLDSVVYQDTLSSYGALVDNWANLSFKKCVVRVNQKEFDKIAALPNVRLYHENNTLDARKSCAVLVVGDEVPNVLKFAKLWAPIIPE